MTISTLDGLIAAFNAPQFAQINKATIANQLAAGWSSLWRATGVPTTGAIPAGQATCTKALTGALLNFTNPGGGTSLYMALLRAYAANANSEIEVHDRLAHMGGLSGIIATSQTVGVDISTLTTRRAADYSDVQWWLEIYSDIGTTGVTATVTYTNQAGTPGQTTTLTIGGASPANRAGRIFPIVGAGTDDIQSIQSIIHATTVTAGSYGITATRRLASLSCLAANTVASGDWATLGLPVIPADACLALIMLCGTTSTGIVSGSAKLITG